MCCAANSKIVDPKPPVIELSSIVIIVAFSLKILCSNLASKGFKEITLLDNFHQSASKAEIEAAIKQASNRALEQATRVEQGEMSQAAMSILPGLG